MNRTTERKELIAILDQLKSAILHTYPEKVREYALSNGLSAKPEMWEDARPVVEGLGMSLEVGPSVAVLRGILAGSNFTIRASSPRCFDELAEQVRYSFTKPPQDSTYNPQAPRRSIGNFRTTADQRRTLEAAEHNLSQAKASGNRELIAVMERALNDTRKRVNFARLEVVHSQSETPIDEPMPTLSIAEQVAVAFAQAINRELSTEEIAEVNTKNDARRKRGPLKWNCHSNKLTDVPALLDQAWEEVTGDLCDFRDNEQSALFNDAFVIARDSGYNVAAIGREIEKAA